MPIMEFSKPGKKMKCDKCFKDFKSLRLIKLTCRGFPKGNTFRLVCTSCRKKLHGRFRYPDQTKDGAILENFKGKITFRPSKYFR